MYVYIWEKWIIYIYITKEVDGFWVYKILKCLVAFRLTYEDSSGVEDHASEGRVLDVLSVVGDVDPPLAGLVGLEGGVECGVLLRDGAAQRAVGGRVGSHLEWKSRMWKKKQLFRKPKYIRNFRFLSLNQPLTVHIINLLSCMMKNTAYVYFEITTRQIWIPIYPKLQDFIK